MASIDTVTKKWHFSYQKYHLTKMIFHNLPTQLTYIPILLLLLIGFLKYQKQKIFFKINVLKNVSSKVFSSRTILNKTSTKVFSCEYCKISRNDIFYRASPVAASKVLSNHCCINITQLHPYNQAQERTSLQCGKKSILKSHGHTFLESVPLVRHYFFGLPYFSISIQVEYLLCAIFVRFLF